MRQLSDLRVSYDTMDLTMVDRLCESYPMGLQNTNGVARVYLGTRCTMSIQSNRSRRPSLATHIYYYNLFNCFI
ncbi:hypothetical protein DPMN_023089 [Dreissena polymorpha]|uniref:Uncharacterized protein n=1 Tax=Dreissena polymorpha TaxID=45954 RepID=A0A9D4LK26_DREPO|nr:hypothetical protein DPMN_023089 [Dreissena polymorpha]